MKFLAQVILVAVAAASVAGAPQQANSHVEQEVTSAVVEQHASALPVSTFQAEAEAELQRFGHQQPRFLQEQDRHYYQQQPAHRHFLAGHPSFSAEHRYLGQEPLSFLSKTEAERHHQYLKGGYDQAYHRTQEGAAEILEQDIQMPDPSHYLYRYKTNNGIEVFEQAALKSQGNEAVQSVQGVYSWVAPNGEKFAVEYVADETGYHPKGAHIPEIPLAIARSLEWNAAHPDPEARKWDREYY